MNRTPIHNLHDVFCVALIGLIHGLTKLSSYGHLGTQVNHGLVDRSMFLATGCLIDQPLSLVLFLVELSTALLGSLVLSGDTSRETLRRHRGTHGQNFVLPTFGTSNGA